MGGLNRRSRRLLNVLGVSLIRRRWIFRWTTYIQLDTVSSHGAIPHRGRQKTLARWLSVYRTKESMRHP